MTRPVIGISCYTEAASWGVWTGVPAALLPMGYVNHVERAGGQAVLIPPMLDRSPADWARVIDRLDGLVVAAGPDIDPVHYDAPRHPETHPPRADRDQSELALLRAAAARDLPCLGICRGLQALAVSSGGTLVQHLPEILEHTGHSPGPARYGAHDVTTAPGSALRRIVGEQVSVLSYHHQAVVEHPGMVATAWSDDGTIEGLEDPTAAFRIAVQWHPEAGTDNRLFGALVTASRRAPVGRR